MDRSLVFVVALLALMTVAQAELRSLQDTSSSLQSNIECDPGLVMATMTQQCDASSAPVCHSSLTYGTSRLTCSCNSGPAIIRSYCGYIGPTVPETQTVMSDVGHDVSPSNLRFHNLSIHTFYYPGFCDPTHTVSLSTLSYTGPFTAFEKTSIKAGLDWETWLPPIPASSNWQFPIIVRGSGRNVHCSTTLTVVATLRFVPQHPCNSDAVKAKMPCSDSSTCGPIPGGDPTSMRCTCTKGGVSVFSYCGTKNWDNPSYTSLISNIGEGLGNPARDYQIHLSMFYAHQSTIEDECRTAMVKLQYQPEIEDTLNGAWFDQDIQLERYQSAYFPMNLTLKMPWTCQTWPSTSPTAIITLKSPTRVPPTPFFSPPSPPKGSSSPSPQEERKLPIWIIAVAASTGVVVLVGIGLLIFCCVRCQTKRKDAHHYAPINTLGDDQSDADVFDTLIPHSQTELSR